MNRRTMLQAIPAAGATAMLPAIAQASTETPVMRGYRQWLAEWRYLNSSEFPRMSDDVFNDICNQIRGRGDKVVFTRSEGPLDVLAKISIATDDCEGLRHEHPAIDLVIAEINRLVGA